MKTVRHPTRRYYTDGHAGHGDNVILVTLPAIPGASYAFDRTDTAPTLPTIRARKPRQIHGAALASQTAAQVDALTRLICTARASTQPAVTVAMEGI